MPVIIKTTDIVTRNLPKFLSPDAHRKADYLVMGGFALAGLAYWRKDRAAAIASAACAGSLFALTIATGYEGRPGKKLSFFDHRRAELGLASVCSLLPGILRTRAMASAHFLIQAAALTAIGNLTGTRS